MLSRAAVNHLHTYTAQHITTKTRNLVLLDLIAWLISMMRIISILLFGDHNVEGLQFPGSWFRILLLEIDLCQRGCVLCRPVLDWTCITLIHRPRRTSKCLKLRWRSTCNVTRQMPTRFIFLEVSSQFWADYMAYSLIMKKIENHEYCLVGLSHPSAANVYLQSSSALYFFLNCLQSAWLSSHYNMCSWYGL
jgi:hypothetical protein